MKIRKIISIGRTRISSHYRISLPRLSSGEVGLFDVG
jgi:hypothetical protein